MSAPISEEKVKVTGLRRKLESGASVFLGRLERNNELDGFGFKFTNSEGTHTYLTLSNEAMQAVIDIHRALHSPLTEETVEVLQSGPHWVLVHGEEGQDE